MPDSNGIYRIGEFLSVDIDSWMLNFTDRAQYRLYRLSPKGSREILPLIEGRPNVSQVVGNQSGLDSVKRSAHNHPGQFVGYIVWGVVTESEGNIGQYLPEVPIGGPAVVPVDDPVNQLEWAPEFREILAGIAEVLDTKHHGKHGANARQRRIETRDATLTDDDMIRNGNVSQVREMIGYVWREMGIWLDLDPTDAATNWNTTELVNVRQMVHKLRDAMGKRPSPRRLFANHNVRQWKALYDRNVRFLPEPAGRPIGVYLPGGRRHSAWEADFDLQNYELAAHYHTDSEGDGYEASTFVALPKPKQVPLGDGTYAARKQDFQQYWVDEMYYLRRLDIVRDDPDSDDTAELLQGYRRFAEMNFLAAKHDSNWADEFLGTRLGTNLLDAEDYVDLSNNPVKERWGGSDAETAWRRGFFVYDTGTGTLVRDAREVDADDHSTRPESVDHSTGDDRLTNVVVVPADRIDRTLAAAVSARDNPWLDEAAAITELEGWFGENGD